jgi:hypothetical protein
MRVDLVLSNPRHHAAMLLPVAAALAARPGVSCRVLSLCELRGLLSPAAPPGVAMGRVVPLRFRSPSALPAGAAAGGRSGRRRRLARSLAWHALLRPSLALLTARRPDVAVLPNDAAYPYDRLAAALRARGVPFVLVQEGVRFPLPSAEGDGYGRGGAAAVAAWGEESAAFFRRQGVPAARVHATGTPRFDTLDTRRRAGTGAPLLLITNPIDDQGFCSTAEKLALVGRFVASLEPLFATDPALRLVVKLHARESPAQYAPQLAGLPFADRVEMVTDAPLHPLLAGARAAVILASTVGLEALLFGLPLGVLEIPGAGFVFDYVQRGAARGLAWDRPMAAQVARLLAAGDGPPATAGEKYLGRALAHRTGATERVADLVADVVAGTQEEPRDRRR